MPAAPQFQSDFLRNFAARGAYYQCSADADLDALMQKERVTAYIGFDATAPSLHVGHALQIMTLRRLQQAGHKPIVLIGGGTTKVGDPSGKDASRKMLSNGPCLLSSELSSSPLHSHGLIQSALLPCR
jgi:tyrosyl-tRNA synthetase